MGVSGHAHWIFSRNANACMRCSATIDRFEARRVIQPIVGKLLLNSVTCFSRRGLHTSSITSHNIRRPANSRSELLIVPVGLSNDTTLLRMVSGHCHRKIVGVHADSSPKITPPTPWLDASTIPMKSGHPHINS
jgi:hypothetical protein